MKSFKTFLQEEQNEITTFYVDIGCKFDYAETKKLNFVDDDNFTVKQSENYRQALSNFSDDFVKSFNNETKTDVLQCIDFGYYSDVVSFTFKIPNYKIVGEFLSDLFESAKDATDGQIGSLKLTPKSTIQIITSSVTIFEKINKSIGYTSKQFEISGSVDCKNITSLAGIENCNLEDLTLLKIPENLGLLSVLKIKALKNISINLEKNSFQTSRAIEQILRKHIAHDKNILKCQKELIENGYKDFAKL